MMKKTRVYVAAVCIVLAATGCSDKLSNKNVVVEKYQGIEAEQGEVSETTEEDIDKVVARMMTGYVAEHDLPEDTEVTDEIVKETLSDSAKTVEQYRNELRKKIDDTKQESVRAELEKEVWEEVLDNAEVKQYPKDRVSEVLQHLKGQYEDYAKEAGTDYDTYMEASGVTEADLKEAAKASVKQELVAEVIANKYGLKPNEEDLQKALEEYAKKYKFSNVDLLLEAVPEEEMRILAMQDNVKEWVTDRCIIVNEDKK